MAFGVSTPWRWSFDRELVPSVQFLDVAGVEGFLRFQLFLKAIRLGFEPVFHFGEPFVQKGYFFFQRI
jgi:hypothetical protein